LPGAPLFYSDHHVGSFDDRVGFRALPETELLDGFVRYRRDYGFAAFKLDFDMRGGRTLANFLDLAFEEIARGYFHFVFPNDIDPLARESIFTPGIRASVFARRRKLYESHFAYRKSRRTFLAKFSSTFPKDRPLRRRRNTRSPPANEAAGYGFAPISLKNSPFD
jgi:hypothetical protein